MCWLEIVLQATQRLAHGLFVLLTSLQIFRCSLWAFTLSVAIRIGITLVSSRLVHKTIRLVVFPSIHNNLVLLMGLASEITVFDIIHTSQLMLNVLIGYFCTLRKRSWLSWLYLAWMYCRPSALGLRASNYLSNLKLSWITACIDFNFRVVYYEVVYIIVRYDVCDHLLVFLTI